MEYTMNTPILAEDGTFGRWSFPSDQWEPNANPFFEPLDPFSHKSDVTEYQLFGDDVIFEDSCNPAWSDGGSYLEVRQLDSSLHSSIESTFILNHVGKGIDMESWDSGQSSWDDLPSSPETFGDIHTSDVQQETSFCVEPWPDITGNGCQPVAAVGFMEAGSLESSEGAAVPECVLPADEMLWEAIKDVITDPLKLLDIGLFLPPVSADDVESLLSSSSALAVPLAAPAPTLDSGSSRLENLSEEQMQTENPEPEFATVSFLPLQLEEVPPAPSPASSQSSETSSAPSCDRRRRKKEQNKTAAQKYREKKRGERGVVVTECEVLERRNVELRTRVEEMTREVDYLKGLIEEICA